MLFVTSFNDKSDSHFIPLLFVVVCGFYTANWWYRYKYIVVMARCHFVMLISSTNLISKLVYFDALMRCIKLSSAKNSLPTSCVYRFWVVRRGVVGSSIIENKILRWIILLIYFYWWRVKSPELCNRIVECSMINVIKMAKYRPVIHLKSILLWTLRICSKIKFSYLLVINSRLCIWCDNYQ